ncbi:hypothetical protein [Streptomyces sp. NPDC126514]|uniref:hypothetical protein n=1 Tax=Streptomyces sp. NPDC126514 TaxID=3155210 RepID=UPI00332AF319
MPELPSYVPRDRDAELDRLVAWGLREGGLVVVTGEPLSGKSMTAWAALRRNADAGARLFNAHPGTDLRELAAALRGRDPAGTSPAQSPHPRPPHLPVHAAKPMPPADTVKE